MTKQEFNLIEKAEEIAKHYQKITDRDAGVQLGISLIMQLNKEFIKRLKVFISPYYYKRINRLTGDI